MSIEKPTPVSKQENSGFRPDDIDVPVETLFANEGVKKKKEQRSRILQHFVLNGSLSEVHKPTELPDFIPDNYVAKTDSKNVFEQVDRERTFSYLSEDPLFRLDTELDENATYKLAIMLYRIRKDLADPFLEVLFIKKDKMYSLPETDYLPGSTENPVEEEGEKEGDTSQIFKQSSLLFEEITGLTQVAATQKYKGFVTVQDELSNQYIVAVYGPVDSDIQLKPETPDHETVWAIIDEIHYKKRILNVPIRQVVLNLFNTFSDLLYIKDNHGEPAKLPYSMYLVENDLNVLYEDADFRNSKHLLIHPMQIHHVFHNTYLFSVEPLEYNIMSRIKRYAVLIDDPLYIFNYDMSLKDSIQSQGVENLDKLRNVRYFEKSKEMWSVKNANSFVEQ